MKAATAIAAGDRAIAASGTRRIHFVDLLRLLASLQMVHGHSLDAVMRDELRHGPIFERYVWCRGLVSVGFLIAAGISFHISTLARFARHHRDRAKVIARIERLAWIVAIGYLLHFPEGLFLGDEAAAARSLESFAEVGVLQCIGVSVILLELVTWLARSARQVAIASAVIAALSFALAPLGDAVDPSGGWRPLANYLTHHGGSLFPLLPWAGYVFAGVVLGAIALPHGARTNADVPAARMTWSAISIFALGACAMLVPLTLAGEDTSRNAEPAFNLLKLGVVIAILAVLASIGRRISTLPRFLTVLAGESLFVYVAHLLVLYATGIGLYHHFGRSLELGPSLALATAMVFLIGGAGLAWHHGKAWRDRNRAKSAVGSR